MSENPPPSERIESLGEDLQAYLVMDGVYLDHEITRNLARCILSDPDWGVVAEEPEWEYGVESRFEESDEAYDAVEWGSREQAEAVARDRNEEEEHEDGYVRLVYSVVKRVPAVPAGPWGPVKQEGRVAPETVGVTNHKAEKGSGG